MASDPRVYTFGEVGKHNHKKDCWLIIAGKVYDVTPFLEEHPGGDEVLLLATEKDATDDFEDVGHSDSAREMMEKYYVGELDDSSLPKKSNFSPPSTAQAAQTVHPSPGAFRVRLFQILTFIVVLGLAFALQYFGKKKE